MEKKDLLLNFIQETININSKNKNLIYSNYLKIIMFMEEYFNNAYVKAKQLKEFYNPTKRHLKCLYKIVEQN